MIWEFDFLSSLQSIHTPFWDKVMIYLSLLGDKGILWIVVAVILMIIAKTRKTGIEAAISMLIAFVIANLILKNAVGRIRPYDLYPALEPLITNLKDASFPSGHAVNAFACATAVFLNHKRAGIIALIVAILISFSRLYNLVHFPTDVIAGAVIGIAVAVLVHYVICKKLFSKFSFKRNK